MEPPLKTGQGEEPGNWRNINIWGRHGKPTKATKMTRSERSDNRSQWEEIFKNGMIKIVKDYGGQIRKGQNASFKFDNKNPHLTIAGAVSVGGMERSLQQIEE